MSTLVQQQQALLQAVLDWPPHDATKKLADYAIDIRGRGLKAYQSNAHALAQLALQAAYPVVAQLLGPDSFAALARALWHAHPPVVGDVARWGAALADFVVADPQLGELPYLADVARCEWALHRAAFAADAVADLSSLGLLTTHDPAALGVDLAPGCIGLSSPWPVVGLVQAHTQGEPTLQQVGQWLQQGVAQDAVVWRAGLEPRLREALAGEVQMLVALQQGQSLLSALQAAAALDFAQWLPLAVHNGLVLRVNLLAVP